MPGKGMVNLLLPRGQGADYLVRTLLIAGFFVSMSGASRRQLGPCYFLPTLESDTKRSCGMARILASWYAGPKHMEKPRPEKGDKHAPDTLRVSGVHHRVPVVCTGEWGRQPGHRKAGRFAAFWAAHDGALLFGQPLTGELAQGELLVQWFERARLEWHPTWPPGLMHATGRR